MSACDITVGRFGAGLGLHDVVGISVRDVLQHTVTGGHAPGQFWSRRIEFRLASGDTVPVTAFAERAESLLVITDSDREQAGDPRA